MCERHGLGAALRHLLRADAPSEAAASADVPAQPPAAPARRRKLWELEARLHCPVVGTCLTLDELERLARKAGFQGRQFDAYRLHVEAVSLCGARNAVSVSIQRLLDRKFAPTLRRFDAAKTDAEVLTLWREQLKQGEVAPAMWAALTHKAATHETRQIVYADVHMLSHQAGARHAADLRRLAWLEKAYADLEQQMRRDAERHAQALADSEARRQSLERAIEQLRAQAQWVPVLRERIETLESGQAMVAIGRRLLQLEAANADLRVAASRALDLERRVEALAAENARLLRERDELAAERDALELLWSADPDATVDCRGDCAVCPDRLKDRCVLCVGGRSALRAQYRALAQRLGVRLIHHDGGREQSLSRLSELLTASDAVICPIDCVSHAAYHQVKRFCKQYQKPCVLPRSSGLASFAAALRRLAEGRFDLGPAHPSVSQPLPEGSP